MCYNGEEREGLAMSIEEEVFKRRFINENKLIPYGFMREKDGLVYEKKFLNDAFKAIVRIDHDGCIHGCVWDEDMDEEYLNIRVENAGEYVSKVREAYRMILEDIKENCTEASYYISEQANRIHTYIKNTYGCEPEFLWDKFPGYGVYRNANNEKWFGLIMNVDYSKLDNQSGEIEIINVKLSRDKVTSLLNEEGFYKAYHMNKEDWISILLNDTVSDDVICKLIDESYGIIAEPETWIVPANPKYYDMLTCFKDNNEMIWKQSSDIHVGDIVFLYVGAPYSKIMYKCNVKEVNIPYEYKDANVSMSYVMKIECLKTYTDDRYSFEYLNTLGIKAIRGPRKISKEQYKKII